MTEVDGGGGTSSLLKLPYIKPIPRSRAMKGDARASIPPSPAHKKYSG